MEQPKIQRAPAKGSLCSPPERERGSSVKTTGKSQLVGIREVYP